MRAQPTKGGDLLALEASVTIEAIEAKRIHLSPWQVRPPDHETARRFAEMLADDPGALPLPDYVLASELRAVNGKPSVYIGTGYARSMAVLKLLKHPTIQARVWRTPGDAKELAFRLALREDALGPRPMSSRDRARNAVRLHEVYPEWSNRQIAREVGLSHTAIDQLARAGWTAAPDARSQRTFDGTRTAERAVRALLDLDFRMTTRKAGDFLGDAIWNLTDAGEELDRCRFISEAFERALHYLEGKVSDT